MAVSQEMIAFIDSMKHSPAHNYVVPGLTSWLIGSPHPNHGCVRMFTMCRHHEEPIIPHSHRFDFRCLVLKGEVINNIWERERFGSNGDPYSVSEVTYEGVLGKHQKRFSYYGMFYKISSKYSAGDEYSMKANQFHSIFFEKGSMVLFFEGPNVNETSHVLEPVVNGETIPLFRTDEWMFRKCP